MHGGLDIVKTAWWSWHFSHRPDARGAGLCIAARCQHFLQRHEDRANSTGKRQKLSGTWPTH